MSHEDLRLAVNQAADEARLRGAADARRFSGMQRQAQDWDALKSELTSLASDVARAAIEAGVPLPRSVKTIGDTPPQRRWQKRPAPTVWVQKEVVEEWWRLALHGGAPWGPYFLDIGPNGVRWLRQTEEMMTGLAERTTTVEVAVSDLSEICKRESDRVTGTRWDPYMGDVNIYEPLTHEERLAATRRCVVSALGSFAHAHGLRL